MKLSTMQKGALLTILGATCWGLSGVLGEYLLNISKLDSKWVISTRLFYSGLILVLILLFKNKDSLLKVFSDKKDILSLMNFSFLGLLICQGTYFLAIKYTNAGMATVIQFTGPVMIMVYYCFVNKRLPMPREVVAILASLFGVVLMFIYYRGIGLSIFCCCAAKVRFILHLTKLFNELLHKRVKNKLCLCWLLVCCWCGRWAFGTCKVCPMSVFFQVSKCGELIA